MIRLFRKYAFLALSPLGWIEQVGLAGNDSNILAISASGTVKGLGGNHFLDHGL